MEDYILLQSTEDGLHVSHPMTKDELKERLLEMKDFKFMTAENFDSYKLANYMNNAMIIKGDIVVPKPKEVVIDYDL